jgi:hypothetical protein
LTVNIKSIYLQPKNYIITKNLKIQKKEWIDSALHDANENNSNFERTLSKKFNIYGYRIALNVSEKAELNFRSSLND